MSFTTCAEINLDHLAYNAHSIRERVAPARVIPVVKADAYGHGAVACARRLAKEGFTMFAVAQFQEAMELRESGIDRPILVLGRLFPLGNSPGRSKPVSASASLVRRISGGSRRLEERLRSRSM